MRGRQRSEDVSKHGVSTSRIYSWRSDAWFRPDMSEVAGVIPVEISGGANDAGSGLPRVKSLPAAQIAIALENGHRLSVSEGAEAGFVLELARGLAA